ncbi:hypothetical protein Tco_1199802 [Tanacetum coccineum]
MSGKHVKGGLDEAHSTYQYTTLNISITTSKRRRVLIYSSPSSALLPPSPSVGPSHKGCMSPTPPLAPATSSSPPTDLSPHHKRFRELIEEMYDHLLEIPITGLKTTKHEMETLRARLISSKREIVALHARARAVKQQEDISRDSLGIVICA